MKVLHEKARHKLRVTMKDKGHTAPSLALACGLSRSLIEKLMSVESKTPSPQAVEKIEDSLQVRIWSSPSEWKRRCLAVHNRQIVPPNENQPERESVPADPITETESVLRKIGVRFSPSHFRRLPSSRDNPTPAKESYALHQP